MIPLQECFKVTEDLIKVLNKVDSNDRDASIDRITELLEKRNMIVSTIKSPFSNDEMEFGKSLVEQNKLLNSLLEKVKLDIQKDLSTLSKRKRSMNRYVNPYDTIQSDGFFYDKRK